MPEVNVTLNKGLKIMENLKQEVKKSSPIKKNEWGSTNTKLPNYVEVNYTHQGVENMEKELVSAVENQRNEFSEYTHLLDDLTNARDALFSGNITSGVSKIIAQIENQKSIIKIWTGLKEGTIDNATNFISPDNLASYYDAQCERHRTLAVDSSFSVRRMIYTDEEINDIIHKAKLEINRLEDSRDQINHSYKIKFSLSDATITRLGLEA